MAEPVTEWSFCSPRAALSPARCHSNFAPTNFAPVSENHLRSCAASGHADYLDTKKLLGLLRARKNALGEVAKVLTDEMREQQEAEKHVESLRAEIRNLAGSEIGHLFKTSAGWGREGC